MQASRKGRSALCRSGSCDQGIGPDPLAEGGLVPGLPIDRADHAERVARRREEHRNRAGLDQRALVQGLVIVAVEQDEVAAPQHRLGDHLVGGAGAVQDEVGLIGAEDAGGVPLRQCRRALVDQQVAEIHVGVAEVVAEDLLPEMLEEELTCRGFAVELPALVAGAVEGDVGFGVVGGEPAEEGWQQAHAVVHQAGDDLLGIEGRGLLAEIDVPVHLAGGSQDRDVGHAVRIRERPDRRAEADRPDAPTQVARRLPAVAVDRDDVGADVGILGHVPIVPLAHLDLELLLGDPIEQLSGLGVLPVHQGDHLEQPMEGDRDAGGCQRELAHGEIAGLDRGAFERAGHDAPYFFTQ